MQRRSLRVLAVVAIGVLTVTGATGCGKHKNKGGAWGHGGFSSGGGDSQPSGLPSDLPSGFPSDLSSGLPSYDSNHPTPDYSSSPSTESTYNSDGTNETSGTNCRYDETTKQFKYDIRVTNTDSSRSFQYSVSVKWEDTTGVPLGLDTQSVTVLPGQSQDYTASAYYNVTRQISYTCEVSSSYKSPAG